jgi:hypothetical protein
VELTGRADEMCERRINDCGRLVPREAVDDKIAPGCTAPCRQEFRDPLRECSQETMHKVVKVLQKSRDFDDDLYKVGVGSNWRISRGLDKPDRLVLRRRPARPSRADVLPVSRIASKAGLARPA